MGTALVPEVVREYLSAVPALFSHAVGTVLAHADPVAVATNLKHGVIAADAPREVRRAQTKSHPEL